MNIAPEQVREARRLLKWPLVRLAARLGISDQALGRIEKGAVYQHGDFRRATLERVRAVLEAAGVEFIGENDGEAGVRLRKVETEL